MSGAVSDAARTLAAQLERQFGRDAELARRLACAQERLMRANDRLWWGVFTPTDLPRSMERTAAQSTWRSRRTAREVLGAGDPLAAVQQVHWSIRKAFIDYQAAAEERRQLAAEVGETIRQLVDELLAAGWSEQHARDANVHELAAPTEQPTTNRS